MANVSLILASLLSFFSYVYGSYYLPGVTPNYYQQGQGVSLMCCVSWLITSSEYLFAPYRYH